jgi:hypothetical protein
VEVRKREGVVKGAVAEPSTDDGLNLRIARRWSIECALGNIAINGLGRIGRAAVKILLYSNGAGGRPGQSDELTATVAGRKEPQWTSA